MTFDGISKVVHSISVICFHSGKPQKLGAISEVLISRSSYYPFRLCFEARQWYAVQEADESRVDRREDVVMAIEGDGGRDRAVMAIT